MNRTRLVCAVATLLMTTAGLGCGGLTTKSFCEQYTSDAVTRLAQCLGAPSDAQGNLEAMLGFDPTTMCAPMEAAVKAKRATFNAAKAQACLNEVESDACGDLPSVGNGPCQEAITGTVKDGGACYTGVDCGPAGYCDATSQTCPGTCHAYVAKGASCSAGTAACINGTYCDGQTCQADLAQGAACNQNGSNTCASGLICTAGTGGGATTCEKPGGPGASCTTSSSGDNCAFGTLCVNGTCTAPKTVGQSCSSDTECGLFTNCLSGKCTEWPKVGGTCGQQGQSVIGCLGSYCKVTSGSTGTCTTYEKTGQPCDQYVGASACGPNTMCDSNNDCAPASSTSCAEP